MEKEEFAARFPEEAEHLSGLQEKIDLELKEAERSVE